MKKLLSHFLIFILFFIFINIVAALLWDPIKSTIFSKINKKNIYSKEILEAIGLEKDEQFIFYNEMWTARKFKYVQFAEHLESETKEQKYVNISRDYGRKVENNKDCEIRIFFYGASQVFGYNLKDYQTIPSFFKKKIDNDFKDKNYCVYNFGSANYYTTQENILFLNHFLEQKILPNDYAIFLSGYAEMGNQKSRIHDQIKYIFDNLELKVWGELKFGSTIFFNSLPIVKLYNHLQNKFSKKNVNLDMQLDILDKNKMMEIERVFKSNLGIRNAICKKISVNCFTFLPPIPPDAVKIIEAKYKLFKGSNYLLDISNVLDESKSLNYVDGAHFSPNASKLIAEKIFKTIQKNFN